MGPFNPWRGIVKRELEQDLVNLPQLGTFLSGVQAEVSDDPQAIPVVKNSAKVRQGQLLGTLFVLPDSAQPSQVDFSLADASRNG